MADGHRKVRRIFLEAVERPPAERRAFLDEACPDPGVRARVESLLRHHDEEPDFLDGRGVTPPLPPPNPGELLGPYRILRVIGQGATSTVFEAADGERHVAIKVMHSTMFGAEAVRRFASEAEIARRLDHPNIVPVLGYVEEPGRRYLVSELSRGQSLSQLLRERGAPLAVEEAVPLVSALARALHYAHGKGIVHRDMKPANVLVEPDGTPRLTDFGHAKDLDAQTLSETGALLGTLPYMSPEQCRNGKEAAAPSDVFSLGIVLFELLAGRRPFAGSTMSDLFRSIQEDTPPYLDRIAPSTPKDLATVCGKALEKDLRHRYATAAELADDLDAALARKPVGARRPDPARRLRRWAHRRPGLAATIVSVVLAAPIAVLAYLWLTDPSPRLTVTSVPRGARLEALPIDPIDGAVGEGQALHRRLGSRVKIRGPGGYYRIVTRVDGAGFAEATRHLPRGTRSELDVRILPTSDVTASMVRIDLDDPAVRDRIRSSYSLAPPPTSFWIDRYEVSNAEFRRYLSESGSDFRPALWDTSGAWDPAWDDLPVSGIPYREAQAYAEWNGKRLPTRVEWEIAARGPDAARYPWGGTEPIPGEQLRDMANVYRDWPRIWATPGQFPALAPEYAKAVLPVRSLPPGFRDVSWAGLLHTLGNVAEWTESVPVQWSETEPRAGTPQFELRTIKGDHWGRDVRESYSLSSFMTYSAEGGAQLGTGFRCVKSNL